ncbi:MAG: hypothetical protein GXO02_01905 [Epsilonproteobacteria bacterium]|nr:hypothetical protein [Campylobacterota bacterium]
MMDIINKWAFHIHLITAIAWIGGSVFMFILGISLRDKRAQQEVYPHIGPIFGWFELFSLIMLLISGYILGIKYNLLELIFAPANSKIAEAIRIKAILVLIITIATIIHFVIAYKTNGKERTKLENILSRASSMLIFILNIFIMHFAIVIRDLL